MGKAARLNRRQMVNGSDEGEFISISMPLGGGLGEVTIRQIPPAEARAISERFERNGRRTLVCFHPDDVPCPRCSGSHSHH